MLGVASVVAACSITHHGWLLLEAVRCCCSMQVRVLAWIWKEMKGLFFKDLSLWESHRMYQSTSRWCSGSSCSS
jgi:hypothetical protein